MKMSRAAAIVICVMLCACQPDSPNQAKVTVARILEPLPPGISLAKAECIELGMNATYTCELRYSSSKEMVEFLRANGFTRVDKLNPGQTDEGRYEGKFRNSRTFDAKVFVEPAKASIVFDKN